MLPFKCVQSQKEFKMASIGVSKSVFSAMKRDLTKQQKKVQKEVARLKELETTFRQLKIIKR